MKTHAKNNGFTLVELLVVIAVIGILAGLMVPLVQGMHKRALLSDAKDLCIQVADAWALLPIDYGIIIAWNSGARTLNCSQAEIVVTNHYYTIHDAWEHELQYVSRPPYESYILRSRGPDGKTVGDTCDSNDHGHTKKKKASDGKEHWLIQDGDVETEDDIVAGVE